jgi:hypothetical protein
MTLTPQVQIAAVVAGVLGGALLAGKTNRLLGAIGGGTLGLVVPFVIWPPKDTTYQFSTSKSNVVTRLPLVAPIDPNNPNNNQNNSS